MICDDKEDEDEEQKKLKNRLLTFCVRQYYMILELCAIMGSILVCSSSQRE